MFLFGFALVPIYDVFCEITGLNGKVTGPTFPSMRYWNREIKITFTTTTTMVCHGFLIQIDLK